MPAHKQNIRNSTAAWSSPKAIHYRIPNEDSHFDIINKPRAHGTDFGSSSRTTFKRPSKTSILSTKTNIQNNLFEKQNWDTNTINNENKIQKTKKKVRFKKQFIKNVGLSKKNWGPTYKKNINNIKRKTNTNIKIENEIKKYENSYKLLVPKKPFIRLVREIASKYKEDLRFTSEALLCLQDCSEHYLVDVFKNTNLLANHDNRESIQLKDMCLQTRLKRSSFFRVNKI